MKALSLEQPGELIWREVAQPVPSAGEALGAIDIALWDLKAKGAGLPLWKLLGGSAAKAVEAYNTDGGRLNWSLETMLADCRRLVEEDGYRAVKIKVGGPSPREDLKRVEAGRNALGGDIRIMTDANGWAAVYLSSPAAAYVTGVTLPVDGGAVVGF